MVSLSISIGELTNFGMFGFDARNMDYDPCESWVNIDEQVQSEQLIQVLNAWVIEPGY
jgi:hypothetical protein